MQNDGVDLSWDSDGAVVTLEYFHLMVKLGGLNTDSRVISLVFLNKKINF